MVNFFPFIDIVAKVPRIVLFSITIGDYYDHKKKCCQD